MFSRYVIIHRQSYVCLFSFKVFTPAVGIQIINTPQMMDSDFEVNNYETKSVTPI